MSPFEFIRDHLERLYNYLRYREVYTQAEYMVMIASKRNPPRASLYHMHMVNVPPYMVEYRAAA